MICLHNRQPVLQQLSASQNNLAISYTYIPGSFNAQGWLNWFELFARRNLSMNGVNQLLFRDWQSVGNNIGEFVVSNATATTQVWDITDPLNPVQNAGKFCQLMSFGL